MNYFIPEGYVENKSISMDRGEGVYWDPSRVERSAIHQFAVYKWALKIIQQNGIRAVFDVGCGFAPKLAWLDSQCKGVEFWGIDQPNAIELCKQHYNFGHWLGVDFEKSPVAPPVRAGLSICSDVIEHVVNPDQLLEYLKKITAGYILISTPERDLLRGRNCTSSPNPFHIREWNRDEFSKYIRSRGFEIIDHKVLPAMKANLEPFYLKKLIRRFGKMKYNQAVFIKA